MNGLLSSSLPRRLVLAAATAAIGWIASRSVLRAAPATGAVRGLDHVGLAVRDIEAATSFLRAALGAEVIYETLPLSGEPRSGAKTEERQGLAPGGRITAIRMLWLGSGPGIELFQVEAPDQHDPARASDLGWQHIALYTDDIESALARFTMAGGTALSEPRPLPPKEAGPGNLFCYARMPFGPIVEFITYPSRQPYRDETERRRWTPTE